METKKRLNVFYIGSAPEFDEKISAIVKQKPLKVGDQPIRNPVLDTPQANSGTPAHVGRRVLTFEVTADELRAALPGLHELPGVTTNPAEAEPEPALIKASDLNAGPHEVNEPAHESNQPAE